MAYGTRRLNVRNAAVKDCYSKSTKQAHSLLNSGVQVLLDAFPVEDVTALGLDRVFCYIITEATDGGLYHVLGEVYVRPALQDQIRLEREGCSITLSAAGIAGTDVTSHLSHSRNEREDVGVVVEQCSGIGVGPGDITS